MARNHTVSTSSSSRVAPSLRTRRPRPTRAETIARITRLLESSETRSLQVADLCEVSGVSERTLRSMFLEAFGVGPKRYLRTRKLHAIRAALAVADARHETVSRVAKRFGLSDVGRMAKNYLVLFGEYPRATLLRNVIRRA